MNTPTPPLNPALSASQAALALCTRSWIEGSLFWMAWMRQWNAGWLPAPALTEPPRDGEAGRPQPCVPFVNWVPLPDWITLNAPPMP